MNSVHLPPCQTSRWRRRFSLVAACVLLAGSALGDEVTAASLPPPLWQGEVNAARALQASLALVPAKDAADDKARHARLATIYRQLAAKYPEVSAVQQAAGDGLAELESPAAGIPYWQLAGTLDPKNAEAADALAAVYLQANRVPEAAAQFQRAVDARPDVASYQFALANVQYLFRHELVAPLALSDDQAVLKVALEHFRRAAELSRGDLRIAKAYAETFYVFAKPDWTQALAAWQTVLALSGEDRDFANSHLARISLRLGRRSDAEGYLASIRSPEFEGLKAKLSEQVKRMPPTKAPPPP